MEDFAGGAIPDRPAQSRCTIDPPFDGRVRELVRDCGVEKSAELIQEMIVNLRSGTCLDRFSLLIGTALDVFAS